MKPYSSIYNRIPITKEYIIEDSDLFIPDHLRYLTEADEAQAAPAAAPGNAPNPPNNPPNNGTNMDQDINDLSNFSKQIVALKVKYHGLLSDLKFFKDAGNAAGVDAILAPMLATAELALMTGNKKLFNDSMKATQKYTQYINKNFNKVQFRGKVAAIAKNIGAQAKNVGNAFGGLFKAIGSALKGPEKTSAEQQAQQQPAQQQA